MKNDINNLEQFINTFDIVDNALDMRSLRRWNGRKLYDEENLAEHTHLVIACVIDLYNYFKEKVNSKITFEKCIILAMIHDSCELFRGDILSITKDSIKGLREKISFEEQSFYHSQLGNFEEIDWLLVDLADSKACYKFIEYELQYTSNDFVKNVYQQTKDVYDKKFKKFIDKYGGKNC